MDGDLKAGLVDSVWCCDSIAAHTQENTLEDANTDEKQPEDTAIFKYHHSISLPSLTTEYKTHVS